MLEPTRQTRLVWAGFCAVLVAVVGIGGHRRVAWLQHLDDHGHAARDWAHRHDLDPLLQVIAHVTGPLTIIALTVLLAVAMVTRGHRRAALYVVLVMVITGLLSRGLRVLVDRPRPPWQLADGALSTGSFPSGHCDQNAALGGVAIVLVLMLVRRRGLRRLLTTLIVVENVVVALDRVLLGRHYPSDTVAGAGLGAAVVLVVLAAYTPIPRGHAERSVPLVDAVPNERRLAVVLNPVKVEDVGAFQSLVTTMALSAGWSAPTWHFTTPEDSGTGQAEQAAVAGADLVIVCGGDGTVREVCAELAGTGVPVGIIPAGTGNLLARNLGVPLYLRAAVDVALSGQDRAIDLVKVRGDDPEAAAETPSAGDDLSDPDASTDSWESYFLVMAGMGFDAAIMEGVNEDFKQRVGWLAYVWSALKSLMFPASTVEISLDGGEFTRHRARTIVVGNVGYLQAGMPLLPDAALDDGVLDVVLLNPRRFVSWIPLVLRVMSKQRRTDELVNRMTGRTISLRTSALTPRQLDGDPIAPGRRLDMECLPGRLLVRVPR